MRFHYDGPLSYFETVLSTLAFVEESSLGKIHEYIERSDHRFQEWKPPSAFAGFDTICFEGHFQDPRYARDVDMSQVLIWPDDAETRWRQLTKKSTAKSRIGIHIRRGDYLNLTAYFVNLPRAYYERAISKFSFDEVLVFSDDPVWCRAQKWIRDLGVVVPKTVDEVTSLYFMTRCDHFAIANSSYSWWGAHLIPSNTKRVYCPDQWWGPEQDKCDFDPRPDFTSWTLVDAAEKEEDQDTKPTKKKTETAERVTFDVRKAHAMFVCGDDATRGGKYARRGAYLTRMLKSNGFKDVTRCKGVMLRSMCALSMIGALDEFCTRDVWQPILWLEDDVDVCGEDPSKIEWTIEYPQDADAVYLGMSQGTLVAQEPRGECKFQLTAAVDGYKTLRRTWNMMGLHAILIVHRRFATLLQRCMLEDTILKRAWDISISWSVSDYNVFALAKPLFYQAYDVGMRRSTSRTLEKVTVSEAQERKWRDNPRRLCAYPPLANHGRHVPPLRVDRTEPSSQIALPGLQWINLGTNEKAAIWLVVLIAWGPAELSRAMLWETSTESVRFVLVTDCPDLVVETGWSLVVADLPDHGHSDDVAVVAAVLATVDLDAFQQVVVVRGDLPPQIDLGCIEAATDGVVVCSGSKRRVPKKWSRVTRRALACHISPQEAEINVPDGMFWYGDAHNVSAFCMAACQSVLSDELQDSDRPGILQVMASAARSTDCVMFAPACFGLLCPMPCAVYDIQTDKISLEYKYIPTRCVGGWEVVAQGSVAAANDVHILLELDDGTDPVICEFIVGGWGNTKSATRFRDQVDSCTAVVIDRTISTFKIRKTDAGFELWVNDKKALWMDAGVENYEVSAVGVHTGYGSFGMWRFDEID